MRKNKGTSVLKKIVANESAGTKIEAETAGETK